MGRRKNKRIKKLQIAECIECKKTWKQKYTEDFFCPYCNSMLVYGSTLKRITRDEALAYLSRENVLKLYGEAK